MKIEIEMETEIIRYDMYKNQTAKTVAPRNEYPTGSRGTGYGLRATATLALECSVWTALPHYEAFSSNQSPSTTGLRKIET
jgi:hypothetical protein